MERSVTVFGALRTAGAIRWALQCFNIFCMKEKSNKKEVKKECFVKTVILK